MSTEIFQTFDDFNSRDDHLINGVSPAFAKITQRGEKTTKQMLVVGIVPVVVIAAVVLAALSVKNARYARACKSCNGLGRVDRIGELQLTLSQFVATNSGTLPEQYQRMYRKF